jgi:hypothetical protein
MSIQEIFLLNAGIVAVVAVSILLFMKKKVSYAGTAS